MHHRTFISALIIYAAAAGGTTFNPSLYTKQLLTGVNEIAAPGSPGTLCVFGKKAFPFVTGSADRSLRVPVAAAAQAGKGRIVVLAHSGYFSKEAGETGDTARFLRNASAWSAGSDWRKTGKINVAVRNNGLAHILTDSFFSVELATGRHWTNSLAHSDVLCAFLSGCSDEEIAAIGAFVANGGGLVTADTPWGWRQLNRNKPLDSHPGTRLLASAGIAWADGFAGRTTVNGFSTTGSVPAYCHAALALDAVSGNTPVSANDSAQAAHTVMHAAQNLPGKEKRLRAQLTNLVKAFHSSSLPGPDSPLHKTNTLGRVVTALELAEIKNTPPQDVTAHPAAKLFPGSIPGDARPVTRTIPIDCTVPGWHSLGLYAAPGALITIDVPVMATAAHLRVRIGCHTDGIWRRREWRRFPEISRSFPVTAKKTEAANAFGGLVYIEVPPRCSLTTIPVTISGGVNAPLYVLDKTSSNEWRKTIREYPGPWAELASDKIIITVPSKHVRTLDDPEALMRLWDRIADAAATLAARPKERARPERYVADVQISIGYMHSGYPLMTHLDAAVPMTSRKKLLEGQWGLYHELGHNHQKGDWTFHGTGEVTVNLFTLYILETVCGKESGKGHEALIHRDKKLKKYLDAGAPFNKWKSDPFLALIMYAQLCEAFGWESYIKVFAEYRDLPRHERPRTDDQKRDQWLVRMSKTVGKNLGPFFEKWGVPTSEQARAQVAHLPAWMPPEFEKEEVTTEITASP